MDEELLWMDAWPYFSGLKVEQNVSLFFLSDFLDGVDCKS
jgi:hypothetical protein